MAKCFIDCGAFTGDTCNLFMERPEIFGVADPTGYEIYAFEPGKQHWDFHFPDRVTLINKAAWTRDGRIAYAGGAGNQGATVVADPDDFRGGLPTVECIDFDQWLERFEGYEEVIVKLDIEGAEFPVLEKLFASGRVGLITRLFVEFHDQRFPNGAARRLALLEAISDSGLPFREW